MNFHSNHRILVAAAALIFLFLSLIIAVLPAIEAEKTQPLEGAQLPTELEKRGRDLYLREGCGTCHTQFVRDLPVDDAYGRGSIAADYALEDPPLLGTQRTGPDLSNVGVRQSSDTWQLIHLYNPRAVVRKSVMPSYPWYFELVDAGIADVKSVPVPEAYRPVGKQVVAREEALALVAYMHSLKQQELSP